MEGGGSGGVIVIIIVIGVLCQDHSQLSLSVGTVYTPESIIDPHVNNCRHYGYWNLIIDCGRGKREQERRCIRL